MKTLLLPGTLCDQSLWEKVTLPGEALSLPALRGASLPGVAQQMLEAVPGPLHLVGFSLGAIVAFEVLRQAPSRVARLTLISANPHSPTAVQLQAWAEQEQLVNTGQFADVVRQISASAGQQQSVVQEMAHRVGAEIFREQLHFLRTRPDSRPALAAFRGPCQLLVGGADQITPLHLSREMAGLMPQATVQVIERAGHYLPLEAPEALSAAIREVTHA